MKRNLLFFYLWLGLPLFSIHAGEKSSKGDWQAEGKKAGLNEDEIRRLGADKVLVSREEMLQSFSPYLGGSTPKFLTADAVLNAYHVLFEETLRLQEEANAVAFQRFFPELWKLLAEEQKGFTGNEALITTARTRAQFIIGVALKLFGGDVAIAPEPLRLAIEEEVAAIEKAEGQRKPVLLGAPEPDFVAFDYTLFRPAGFYADSPGMQRYFRVVRWLQLVPFRTKQPAELLSFLMMDSAMAMDRADEDHTDRGARDSVRRAFGIATDIWKSFGFETAGCPLDDNGNHSFFETEVTAEFLEKEAVNFARHISFQPGYLPGNDRIRELPSNPRDDPEFRFLAPLDLPEAQAFRAAALVNSPSGPPAGLEFASWLGVPLARDLLQKRADDGRLAALDDNLPEKRDSESSVRRGWEIVDDRRGLCWAQMHALRGILELDPTVPAFMRSEIWQRKSLLTVCASWAQYRHAWMLQAKSDVNWLSASTPPQQLIEPLPEFYHRLGLVCLEMAHICQQAQRDSDLIDEIRRELDSLADGIRDKNQNELFEMTACSRLRMFAFLFDEARDEMPDDLVGLQKWIPFLETKSKLISARDPDTLAAINKRSAHFKDSYFTPERVGQLWNSLSVTCLRLALLCHKQLALTEFTISESSWLGGIGEQLAQAMLYEGNSYHSPNDDAPRIARLSSNPADGSVLHVGIGRPRVLYILYPWKGEEIFCEGAVIPYHEFTDSKTLTDEEWRSKFRKGNAPESPKWLQDFVPPVAVRQNKQ